MINNAVVRYIGHFENAIELAGLECLDDMKIDFSILRSSFRFPVGHGVIVPASRLQEQCPPVTERAQCESGELHRPAFATELTGGIQELAVSWVRRSPSSWWMAKLMKSSELRSHQMAVRARFALFLHAELPSNGCPSHRRMGVIHAGSSSDLSMTQACGARPVRSTKGSLLYPWRGFSQRSALQTSIVTAVWL